MKDLCYGKDLVTGGCGFVGRHLIQRLLIENNEVHCVDPLAPLEVSNLLFNQKIGLYLIH